VDTNPQIAAIKVPDEVLASVMADVERRHNESGLIFGFGEVLSGNLTGAPYPDVVIAWNEGGSCGHFHEVWGYSDGAYRNLSPNRSDIVNDFGCGGADIDNYLSLANEQLATASRTYGASQFSGGEYQARTVWCWTGMAFLTIVSHYEDSNGRLLRSEPRNAIDRCK
jgi:hypothetical protein